MRRNALYAEGGRYISREYKQDGIRDLVFNDFRGSGRFAKQASSFEPSVPFSKKSKVYKYIRSLFGGSTKLEFTRKRTISLGNYEYAKIKIYMSVCIRSVLKKDKDMAYDLIIPVVGEILERERSAVLGIEREDEEIDWDDSFLHSRVIGVNYSLTRRAKIEGEFWYVDLGLDEPIPDKADLSEEIARIQTEVSERIDVEIDKISTEDLSLDLGI